MDTVPAAQRAVMDHEAWMAAATEEYRRLRELLGDLTAAEWAAPTDCTGWDVHAVVAHVVGAARASGRFAEAVRQQRLGRRLMPDADVVDGMNAVQVRERADRTSDELVSELVDVAPRAVRARRRLPRPLRALPVPFGSPLGTRPLGYLTDCIYTRDVWLHRIDISRATGRPPALTADHDALIVADVVAEWARTHGRPYALTLTGPAGGIWSEAPGGEGIELDAVQFCRLVSGRGPASGLLAVRVPF